MATARCYTKSGGVEKYESNLWSSPTFGNWSSMGVAGTITTPDSNGNYTVTPEQSFEDSSDATTYSCFTEYGGVKKTFYFKKKEGTGSDNPTYNINCKIWVTGNGHEISICADNIESDIQMPIPGYDVHDVYDLLRKDVIDTHIKVFISISGNTISDHVIDFELSSYTWNGYVTPHFKYTVKFPNYNDNIVEEYGIGDIGDDVNTKKKTITSKYNNCIYNVNYYIE